MKSAYAKEVKVTDELIKDLDSGEVDMAELGKVNPVLFKALGEHLDNLDQTANAQPTEVVVPLESEPAPKGFVDGKKFKEKADEASDYQNKWKSSQERLRKLESLLAEKEKVPVKAPEPGTVWTDEFQVEQARKMAELEQKLDEAIRLPREENERNRAEIREDMDNTELKILGSKFKDLAVTEPIAKMEARYSEFYYAVAGIDEKGNPKDPEAVSKFFSDPEFRKGIEAKGVKAPADIEQVNKILKIKAIREKYQKIDPDFTLTKAHAVYLAENNKLDSMFMEAELKGAAKIADKLHASANETITMQPGLTSDTTQDGWSDAQINDWLDKHPHPKTKDEKATFKRIGELLDSRGL